MVGLPFSDHALQAQALPSDGLRGRRYFGERDGHSAYGRGHAAHTADSPGQGVYGRCTAATLVGCAPGRGGPAAFLQLVRRFFSSFHFVINFHFHSVSIPWVLRYSLWVSVGSQIGAALNCTALHLTWHFAKCSCPPLPIIHER